jgi:hypothetical protein
MNETVLDAPGVTVLAWPVRPTDWCTYETPSGHTKVGFELELPRLREDIASGSIQIIGGGITEPNTVVSDGTRCSAVGRHAFVRMDGYEVYVPLEGAPTSWIQRAKREGFALALVPVDDDGQVPFLVTGEPEQEPPPAELTYVPGGRYGTTRIRPGEKVGRNSPCPCGSGRKLKRCHGEVAA